MCICQVEVTGQLRQNTSMPSSATTGFVLYFNTGMYRSRQDTKTYRIMRRLLNINHYHPIQSHPIVPYFIHDLDHSESCDLSLHFETISTSASISSQ